MQKLIQNSILTKCILGVLLSFVFLSPVSLSITAEKALAQNPPVDISGINNDTNFEINNTNSNPIDITNDPLNGGGFEVNNDGVTNADINLSVSQNDIVDVRKQTGQGLIKNNAIPKNTGGWEQTIGNAILQIAAYITYFGGLILKYTIEKLVFGMGTQLENGIGNSIDSIWTVIRDICNLAFIFGFIYVGIRTIIDPASADTKRFLAQIIIGALLINFSLFITKIVIDFSNFSTVQIYSAMIDNPEGDISYAFAEKLGITGWYKPPDSPDMLAQVTGTGQLWFYIMGAIMLVVAGFVLAAGGILLVVRFVALILIMMFSPILFVAGIFPQTAKYAKDLWGYLISYSFFAPVYILLLIASLKVLEGATQALGIGGSSDTLANAVLSDNADSFAVILNFVIVIMFLIFSLQIAQKMGVKGGELAVSTGNRIRKSAQRGIGATTAGLAARAGRSTAGKFGNKISERDGLKDAAAQKGVRGFMARQTLKGSRAIGDASFDARNVAGAGTALGIGEGRKGGYTTVKKEVQEKEEKFGKSLGEVGDDDVQVQARKQEMAFEEKKLRIMEEQLNAIDKSDVAARTLKREEIEQQRREINDTKTKYEKEKQRRIIGSTYSKPESEEDRITVQAQKDEIKNLKDAIKTRWETYVTLNDADKESQRPFIENFMEDLKKKQDAHNAFLNQKQERGYAGVLETSTIPTAWPVGRLVSYEKEAGKAMRKTAEKGLPKEKDA